MEKKNLLLLKYENRTTKLILMNISLYVCTLHLLINCNLIKLSYMVHQIYERIFQRNNFFYIIVFNYLCTYVHKYNNLISKLNIRWLIIIGDDTWQLSMLPFRIISYDPYHSDAVCKQFGWFKLDLLVGREIFSGAVQTEKSQTPFCPFIGEAQLGNTKIMLSISKRVHVCKVRGMTISAVSPANAEFCV